MEREQADRIYKDSIGFHHLDTLFKAYWKKMGIDSPEIKIMKSPIRVNIAQGAIVFTKKRQIDNWIRQFGDEIKSNIYVLDKWKYGCRALILSRDSPVARAIFERIYEASLNKRGYKIPSLSMEVANVIFPEFDVYFKNIEQSPSKVGLLERVNSEEAIALKSIRNDINRMRETASELDKDLESIKKGILKEFKMKETKLNTISILQIAEKKKYLSPEISEEIKKILESALKKLEEARSLDSLRKECCHKLDTIEALNLKDPDGSILRQIDYNLIEKEIESTSELMSEVITKSYEDYLLALKNFIVEEFKNPRIQDRMLDLNKFINEFFPNEIWEGFECHVSEAGDQFQYPLALGYIRLEMANELGEYQEILRKNVSDLNDLLAKSPTHLQASIREDINIFSEKIEQYQKKREGFQFDAKKFFSTFINTLRIENKSERHRIIEKNIPFEFQEDLKNEISLEYCSDSKPGDVKVEKKILNENDVKFKGEDVYLRKVDYELLGPKEKFEAQNGASWKKSDLVIRDDHVFRKKVQFEFFCTKKQFQNDLESGKIEINWTRQIKDVEKENAIRKSLSQNDDIEFEEGYAGQFGEDFQLEKEQNGDTFEIGSVEDEQDFENSIEPDDYEFS